MTGRARQPVLMLLQTNRLTG